MLTVSMGNSCTTGHASADSRSPDVCQGAAAAAVTMPKITEAEVKKAQAAWASAIKTISKTYIDKGDFVGAATKAAGELYGYGKSNVLFKPTKAAEYPFRPTAEDAMSYFVGGSNVKGGYKEDGGFAINGGKGWSDVVFDNHQIELLGDAAIAMGTYYFTCATTGDKTKVEYTFGYKRNDDGKLRIFLHHSSVPFKVEKTVTMPKITEADVKEAQAAWASAIKTISKTYLDKGDFVGAAGTAAGQLYGYGKSNVLFKPTKAAEYPFRPTADDAMSYFVGEPNVKGGYKEDGGFAINGGKGWSDVVFDNHQIELLEDSAIAMGTYYFTCATTGDKTKVEYTFGYKRNDDGKLRIFLHHSSVPFKVEKTVTMPKITEADVKEAQAVWASVIKTISKTYLDKGDFVGAAGTAAGQLYGSGKSNVLFKPSKAADYCPLPNLLSNNAHNVVKLKGNPTTVAVAHQKHSALFGVNNSKPVVDAKGAAVDPGQSTVIESATVDSAQKKEQESKIEAFAEMKSFVDVKHRLNGASVEYYSKSYGEWIPAIIGDVRANACPTLLHADGSVLKLEADPDSVRLAPEQARQNSDSKVNSETLAKFNPSFSAGAMERYLQAANCITEANSERSFGEGSKEAYDEQMKLLHSRSEKLNAQLKIHRPWKIHAEKILNLEKGLGCDTTN